MTKMLPWSRTDAFDHPTHAGKVKAEEYRRAQWRLIEKEMTGAANLIRDVGWTQKTLCRDKNGIPCGIDADDVGSYCASSAIHQACYELGEFDTEADYFFRSYLKTALGNKYASIAKWNDAENRTAQEVESVFRKAAEYARLEAERDELR